MYIFSFFKSLLNPKNWLATLYFLLNTAIIFLLFGIFNFFNLNVENEAIYNGLIGLGINLVFLLITLTPFGEAILRFNNKVRKIDNPNDAWILDIFNEVYTKAIAAAPRISAKIKLYYTEDNVPNAFAIGRRTVIVTTGLVQSLNTEQLKGVIAHEFSHLIKGDSCLKLGINLSNIFVLIFIIIARLFAYIFSRIRVLNFLSVVFDVVLVALFTLWMKIGNLMVAASSRSSEYTADNFAAQIGYGEELCEGLSIISECGKDKSFLATLNASHPSTPDRLQRLYNSGLIESQAISYTEEQ